VAVEMDREARAEAKIEVGLSTNETGAGGSGVRSTRVRNKNGKRAESPWGGLSICIC